MSNVFDPMFNESTEASRSADDAWERVAELEAEVEQLKENLAAQKAENASFYQAAADNEREIQRLQKEGTPGVMHSVDKAFYDLVVKERNYERVRVERLTAEVEQLRKER